MARAATKGIVQQAVGGEQRIVSSIHAEGSPTKKEGANGIDHPRHVFPAGSNNQ